LNLRPLGPEISGAGSHRVSRAPTASQVAGTTGAGGSARSYPVASDRHGSIGSCTFSAQNPESVPRFLTVREVAERLRVCRATVYRMIDEGRLPAVRVSSGAIRVDAALVPRS
jgi:excisionase family DNA binding protein